MNGVEAIRVGCVEYKYYIQGWSKSMYCVHFYKKKVGWVVGGEEEADKYDFAKKCDL